MARLCAASETAGTGAGWIADHRGWNGVFAFMIVCCLLTIVFRVLTLGSRTHSNSVSP